MNEKSNNETAGPCCAPVSLLGGWSDIATAPKDKEILISWGSKTCGHLGYALAKWRHGRWVDASAFPIEEDGYCVIGWMELPKPPNAELSEPAKKI